MIEELTGSQQKALSIMQTGKNVFLSGDAGTGKSFLVTEYINWCEAHGKKVLKTAPTGIAARNIEGVTLHSAFKIPTYAQDPRKEIEDTPPWVDAYDVIIIDEISMVRMDTMDYVFKAVLFIEQKTNRKVQVIVVGDFFQLPPVMKDVVGPLSLWYGGKKNVQKGYAFMGNGWRYFNFEHVFLDQVVRQSNFRFSKALHNLREGKVAGLRWIRKNQQKAEFPDAPWIFATNQQVNAYNTECLDKIEGKEVHYFCKKTGIVKEDDAPAPEDLVIKVGAKVMLLVNEPSGAYQNGSFGTVTGLDDKYIVVKLDNGFEVAVEPYKWLVRGYSKVPDDFDAKGYDYLPRVIGSFTQFPVKLAYAFTIHKVQGRTFSFPINISATCLFATGQLYTALSRVTEITNVYVEWDRDPKYKVDPVVKKFYKFGWNGNATDEDLSEYDGDTIEAEVC